MGVNRYILYLYCRKLAAIGVKTLKARRSYLLDRAVRNADVRTPRVPVVGLLSRWFCRRLRRLQKRITSHRLAYPTLAGAALRVLRLGGRGGQNGADGEGGKNDELHCD